MSNYVSERSRCCWAITTLCVCIGAIICGPAICDAQTLTFEERVACQRAIEDVLWQHRIWPVQNPTPKPAFSEIMPDGIVRSKVDEMLRLNEAIQEYWQRPITAADLQAEIDRVVEESTAPEMLDEMLRALGYDPFLAAECLARPLLVERTARAAFAGDEAIHGNSRRQAEDEHRLLFAKVSSAPEYDAYTETEWVRYGKVHAKFERMRKPETMARDYLTPSQWQALTAELSSGSQGVPKGRFGPLRESDESWWSAAVLEAEDGRWVVGTAVWPKRSFDDWWAQARSGFQRAAVGDIAEYEIPARSKRAPTANSWTATVVNATTPSERYNHTAIWTGSEMIVWGGRDSQSVMSSGAKYYPATNSWGSMTSGGGTAPSRSDHTAVWTGSEMWIWGGWNGTEMNSGARYNLTYNSWSAMETTNAPTDRRYHSAFWSGSDMVIWGGWNGSSYLGNGAEYRFNVWDTLPTSSSGITDPSPRADHTAVFFPQTNYQWAVFWGGQDSTGALGNGRRLKFQFATPEWTAMSSTGAPSARYDHTATVVFPTGYTADRQIVTWGGTSNGTSGLITGASYDPVKNIWLSMNISGSATSRWGHRAEFTGRTVVVWGGESSSGPMRSGGVYNPYNKKWLTTTQTGAPTARTGHATAYNAVSGYQGEFIVWGGNAGGATDTGGVYVPPSDFILYGSHHYVYGAPGATLSNDVRLHVGSLNGFTGSAALSASGVYPLTPYFSQNPVSVPANSAAYADVTFNFTHGYTPGSYDFDFVASSGGQTGLRLHSGGSRLRFFVRSGLAVDNARGECDVDVHSDIDQRLLVGGRS